MKPNLDPQVGFYTAECCLLDLYRINDEQELEETRKRIADTERGPLLVFPSLAVAIAELRGTSGLTPEEEDQEFKRLGWPESLYTEKEPLDEFGVWWSENKKSFHSAQYDDEQQMRAAWNEAESRTRKKLVEKGPWEFGIELVGKYPNVPYIESSRDDIRLYVDGDFDDAGEKLDYAKTLADILNAVRTYAPGEWNLPKSVALTRQSFEILMTNGMQVTIPRKTTPSELPALPEADYVHVLKPQHYKDDFTETPMWRRGTILRYVEQILSAYEGNT